MAPDPVNYRNQFKVYLRKDNVSDRVAEKFISLLTTIVDFYIQLLADSHHKTVFEIADVDLLIKYRSILMNDPVFTTQNSANARLPEVALVDYIEFVKSLPEIKQSDMEVASKSKNSTSDIATPKPDDILVKAQLIQQNQRHELIRQAQIILQPIEEYLIEYQLTSIITFEYHSAFQDVDVIAPRFNKDVNTEAEELEQLVTLMRKYKVAVPTTILRRHVFAKEMKELRNNVRSFENWVVGYVAYLPLKYLEVHSIYYSPDVGFRISLSGNNIDPTTIKIKTSIVAHDSLVKRKQSK